MLSIQSQASASKCIPNVLPCRISHNGPANASKRYWYPETDDNDKKTAYFRGRKLHGRSIKVPAGYKGSIIQSTTQTLSSPADASSHGAALGQTASLVRLDEDSEDEEVEPIKVLDEVASFDEMVVWGHEIIPGKDDTFVKGVEEWIGFAEAIHSTRPVEGDARSCETSKS